MAVDPKIIYLEADEEVTSAVEKLRKTEFKSVVFVVPKEASLLQGVVNLKLLKRQAENLEKTIAIVTQDKVGRTLADKVGILASSKLENLAGDLEYVPAKKELSEDEIDERPAKKESENSPLEDTKEVIFKDKKTVSNDDEEEQPDLVIREESPEDSRLAQEEAEEEERDNLMPRFPWRNVLIGGGAVLLILLSLGFVYIPRARATILVQAERKPISINFTGKKDVTLDSEKAIVPVKTVEVTKDASKKFPATGKRNDGNKASGTLSIANMSGSDINWVSGTRFAPSNNSAVVFAANSPVYAPKSKITQIQVTAAQAGDQYNGFGGSSTNFTLVSGGLNSNIIINSDSGLSGGSNKEVSFVTQGDFDAAKDTLSKDTLNDATSDFNKQVESLKVVDDSKKDEVVSADSTPDVNGDGSDFTLSVKVRKKALAFSLDDISNIIKAEVSRQLGLDKQVVDDGASNATMKIDSSDYTAGTLSGSIKTDAYVSSKFDENSIKNELVGKDATAADKYLKGLDGVQETQLEFFPSFLKLFPRITSHIFLKISVAGGGV